MKNLFLYSFLLIVAFILGNSLEFEELYNIRRLSDKPILLPQGTGFETKATFNPAAIMFDEQFHVFYRAEDWTGVNRWNGTSRIGLAVSDDGLSFMRFEKPFIEPTEDYELLGGCEDPRIVYIDGRYILTYTGYDGSRARLCIAVSQDLRSWEKLGPVIKEFNWSKSGAIIPVKIDNKYFMYFGDSKIFLAYSENLKDWTVYSRAVLEPRPNKFDSSLVEPGPPPLITDEGILLIYNSADYSKIYRPGAVLFDLNNPRKILKRTDSFLMEPELTWEKYGQVPNVVFIEGAVVKDNTLYLYYGAADTYTGVAGMIF